jgi:hypothetical protein
MTTLVRNCGGDGIRDYAGRKLRGRRRWSETASRATWVTSLVEVGGCDVVGRRRRWCSETASAAALEGDDAEGGDDVGRSRFFGVEVVSLLEPESARRNVCGDPCVGRRPSPWRRGTRLK